MTYNNTPEILLTYEGGNKEKKVTTSEGANKQKLVEKQCPTTNHHYYNGLEQINKVNEEIETKTMYERIISTIDISAICKSLDRETQNNKKRKRNKQKEKVRGQTPQSAGSKRKSGQSKGLHLARISKESK